MPGINYSQPILGAGASAQTDFAAARARTGLNFQGAARFKRGVKAELGLEAFADASAELSKFVKASIEGTAFARAQAGVQLQLPLNLFDEFGFAVRAEAIAEAAAGVTADLGLSVGDFILLAQRDQDLIGLPLELLLLFLEEVSLGGAFEVNVSASAKAHASITVTGCVVERSGQKAGFFYTVDAGVGLAAGVGMGFKVGAEFRDFRRFYGRATDRVIDTAIGEIVKLLPASAAVVVPVIGAFAPVAKIALRIAYDVGRKVSENRPGNSRNDMNTLCNEAVKTVLEECQRFIIQKMLDGALDALRSALEQQVSAQGQTAWDSALQERTSLAGQLLALPDEPFQPTQANIDYWNDLIRKGADLLNKLSGNNPDPGLVEALSILYCASELLLEAVRSKVNRSSAYASAIGAGTVSADTRPFDGSPQPQPQPLIKRAINSSLGRTTGAASNSDLTYADLLQFLLNDLIVDRLLAASPEVAEFMAVFKDEFAATENELLKTFLLNAGSFVPAAGGGGEMNPHATLQLIVNSLDRFVTDKVRAEALPRVLEHVRDANTRLYVEEVLFDAVVYVKDVALSSILTWEGKSFDNDDFTESLAAVMTLLLGRTVVIVADTFLNAAQEKIGDISADVADKIERGDNSIRGLNLPVDPDFVRLAADSVRIAGEVLGPLPSATRSRIRHLLYQTFEPIPPGAGTSFLDSLGDDLFIPNVEQLNDLTDELTAISQRRFALFVEKFVLAIGNYLLEQLEELLLQLIELIVEWEENLVNTLAAAAQFLTNIEDEIRDMNAAMIHFFNQAEDKLHELFALLSGSSLRSAIKSVVKSVFVDKALGGLEDNDFYQNLPREFREGVRSNLRSAVDGLMSILVDPVMNAVGGLADSFDELMLDCRGLDPDENLPEQIMLLVLDKIEESLRDHFGSTKPRINVGFDFGFTDWLGNHHSVHFSLGRFEMNLNPFLNLVRETIEDLDFYHDALNDVCFNLAHALGKELELVVATLRQKAKEDEKQRLDKISAEHHNAPKEIVVLNPTTLSHHTKAVDFKIHLGGVPLSSLGLEQDESQRVLIYLNGELIPVKSLLVEQSTRITDVKKHDADFEIKSSKSFDAGTGIFKNGVASIITDTAMYYPAHSLKKHVKEELARSDFGSARYMELAVANSVSAANGKKRNGSSPSLGVKVKTDGKGRAVNEYEVMNNLPGRGNALSRENELMKITIPGIMVQFKVQLSGLTAGVNVLTVVVVEKGGNRHQQNVSFTVSKPQPKQIKAGSPTDPSSVKDPAGRQPPKQSFILTVKEAGSDKKPKAVNTTLPADAAGLKLKREESLKYLRAQNQLNLIGK